MDPSRSSIALYMLGAMLRNMSCRIKLPSVLLRYALPTRMLAEGEAFGEWVGKGQKERNTRIWRKWKVSYMLGSLVRVIPSHPLVLEGKTATKSLSRPTPTWYFGLKAGTWVPPADRTAVIGETIGLAASIIFLWGSRPRVVVGNGVSCRKSLSKGSAV